jgi:hypothetical protein
VRATSSDGYYHGGWPHGMGERPVWAVWSGIQEPPSVGTGGGFLFSFGVLVLLKVETGRRFFVIIYTNVMGRVWVVLKQNYINT